VLAFVRDIEDIEQNIKSNTRLAARFIDLDSNDDVDKESQALLANLKQRVLTKVPQKNIHHFKGVSNILEIIKIAINKSLNKSKLKWDKETGISSNAHKEYIENFANNFFESVKRLIDENARRPYFLDKFSDADRSLFQEVLEHARFSVECVKKFHGRVDLLDKVVYSNNLRKHGKNYLLYLL